MKLWNIDADDIKRLQGRDRQFADLVNDLLMRHTRNDGVPQSALRLNLNTLAPDGGVDAAVDQALSAATPGDYCDVPTCWQYKASPSGNLKPPDGVKGGQQAALVHEINKPEVTRLIGLGYGYRLCIADEITPDRIAKFEGWLRDEAIKIRADAAPPRVLTASRLATWINRYPGLIKRLRTDLGPFRDLDTLKEEIQYRTLHFHPVADWDNHLRTIREFADFSRTPPRAVLSVRGEAGVGKTRCVYEAVASDPANRALVAYTTSETDAETLASQLAGNLDAMALIIADECGQGIAIRMDRRLLAHSKRLRVIAIDNQQQSEQTSIGELRLSRLTGSDVLKILEINFPGITRDRLRAFSELSEGFVRLAVDLCDHQELIPLDGSITGSLTEFFRRHYLSGRLNTDDLTAVLIVSLVTRVGFAAEVAEHLVHLCQACRSAPIDAVRIIETARRLKQSPGFIALGERFLYVTPRLIAQAAFRTAWERWVGPDPNAFYVNLHADLVEPFLRQLRDAGTDDMRKDCADFFMTWTSSLVGEDLADEAKVRQLVRLADVEPNTVLPQIRRVVESIPRDTLTSLHASTGLDTFDLKEIERSSRGQAARRELVWFAERFLSLPEHFEDAERILYRLALAETEYYGNNASGIWKQIFQITLSGTSLPYHERITLLELRFRDATEDSIKLLVGGLDACISGFQHGMSRVVGPAIVAGRIPPSNWRPESNAAVQDCWNATVLLLQRLSQHPCIMVRDSVLALTIDRLPVMIFMGSLKAAVELIDSRLPLRDVQLPKLLQEIDEFVEIFCEEGSRRVSESVEQELRAWRERMVPDSLHGKLVALIGEEPWRRWNRKENDADPEIEQVAQPLLSSEPEFERELPWLLSEEAKSSFALGVALGELDARGVLLERMLSAASKSSYPALCRGYIKALAETHTTQIERINLALDHYQQKSQKFIFDLISTGCSLLHPLERVLSMVDGGLLPAVYLRGYAYTGGRDLSVADLKEVMKRLISAGQRGDSDAARAALDVLWIHYRSVTREGSDPIGEDPSMRQLVVDILELTPQEAGREAHAWNELVGELAKHDPGEAIRFASKVLSSRELNLAEAASSRLQQLSASHPREVMQGFGDALLAPDTGIYLGLRSLRHLVLALPVDVVRAWLEQKGDAAAIAIARHLPEPVLTDGVPVVPDLTTFVLDRFEQNERVYREFCAGISTRDYSGDIARQIEREAEEARPFLSHQLLRIREWAQYQISHSKQQAAYWRALDEEDRMPR